jgi:hypothetical protein
MIVPVPAVASELIKACLNRGALTIAAILTSGIYITMESSGKITVIKRKTIMNNLIPEMPREFKLFPLHI